MKWNTLTLTLYLACFEERRVFEHLCKITSENKTVKVPKIPLQQIQRVYVGHFLAYAAESVEDYNSQIMPAGRYL